MEFAGPIHGVIDLPYLIERSFDLIGHRNNTDDVALVEHLHGLQVLRVVRCACRLMAEQSRLYLWGQFIAQAVGLSDPQGHTGEGTGKDEAHQPPWLGESVLNGEHPTPRLTQKMDLLKCEGAAHYAELLDKTLHAPERGVAGLVGTPAAELIIEDDPASVG